MKITKHKKLQQQIDRLNDRLLKLEKSDINEDAHEFTRECHAEYQKLIAMPLMPTLTHKVEPLKTAQDYRDAGIDNLLNRIGMDAYLYHLGGGSYINFLEQTINFPRQKSESPSQWIARYIQATQLANEKEQ